MKNTVGIIVFIFIAQFAFAQPGKLKQEKSHVKFTIRNAGLTVDGKFREYDAIIDFKSGNPEKSNFYTAIKVASIDTGIGMRDRDLMGEKYFHQAKYPEITFQSTKVIPKKGKVLTVSGQLLIKGIKKQVSFDVNYTEHPNETIFTFSLPLNRRDFGVGGSSWILADDLNAEIQMTASSK